jgi:hypothetical protein
MQELDDIALLRGHRIPFGRGVEMKNPLHLKNAGDWGGSVWANPSPNDPNIGYVRTRSKMLRQVKPTKIRRTLLFVVLLMPY